tara:strand:- start:196 stop:1029 length:834 start_codon:yes stop_codon:yes gene_type:complete
MNITIYSDKESLTSTQFLEEGLRQIFGANAVIRESNRFELSSRLSPATDLFIVPGIIGETCLYYDHLSGDNARHIQNYVAGGGVYLGICAGAYQVMTDIRFTDPDGSVRTRQSPYGFIDGHAQGPINGTSLYHTNGAINGHTAVRPMELSAHFAQFNFTGRAIYSSGPAFYPATTTGVGLARYQDHPEKPIGLISSYYGDGLVIGSGTAPYYSADSYPDINPKGLSTETYETAKNLRDTLKDHEQNRFNYWNLILQTAQWHRQNLAQKPARVLANSA